MQDDYDFVSHLTRFCRLLREHGLLIGPREIGDAVKAISLIDLMAEGRIYWTLRKLLHTAGFKLLAGGLAAATPHVDRFVPAGGVADLKRLPLLLRS